MKIKLNNLYEDEIKDLIKGLDISSYRADQIFRAIHSQNVSSIEDINQLSKSDRNKLKEISTIGSMEILEVFKSQIDQTKKILYKLEDNHLIEGVLMKYHHGYSLCVSTQVGCRMGCSFCASTKDGRPRDLETFEIIGQVYLVEEYFKISLSNIVLMGSGEPLDNYDSVIRALDLINDPKGRNLSLRSITLSTCGLAEKIKNLAHDKPQIGLAVSLHSLDDKIRSQMMPVNKYNDLELLFDSLHYYQNETNNRISFEYTVIPGKNNRDEDVRLLKNKLKNMNYIINLIALNPIEDYNKNENYKKTAQEFKYKLDKENINNTLRRELGSDISASCGQLKQHYLREGEG